MGKPRMILLVRHAQSEGNKNRDIHQMIPDHRVKLTQEGWQQAEEAGRKLRSMLRPDDTVRFFTSPYRRTRETTEGILKSLTDSSPEAGPSPFSRNTIKVYEEPRLREQDFGNFQPCSAEMERMWQERADYGHFFYRIPDGESAADAYDRVSGFNESMWRAFNEDDFPSVCILVTHGLMTRVFLMKWYHWSVEYFEDLRNINHCEFVVMKRDTDNGKFELENKLRTWSELKRRATVTNKAAQPESPALPSRQWGGCVEGCNHDHSNYPRRNLRKSTMKDIALPPPSEQIRESEKEDHAIAAQEVDSTMNKQPDSQLASRSEQESTPDNKSKLAPRPLALPTRPAPLTHLGRDAGGTLSGAPTPATEHDGFGFSDSEDVNNREQNDTEKSDQHTPMQESNSKKRGNTRRRPTVEDLEEWARQSGMGTGARADALGDEPEDEESDGGGGEIGEDTKRFGYEKDAGEDLGPKNEKVKEVEDLEKKDRSLRGSVY